MRRKHTPELMDAPDASRVELDRALRFIEGVNRRLGGVDALLRHLGSWSADRAGERPMTLLDIATGAADLPIAAARWAKSAGIDLRITAVDLHPTTVELARERVAASGVGDAIDVEQADAFGLVERYGVASFDYVHAGLFLHHLENEVRVLTMLAMMDRLAREGVVWNDLVRSRVGYAFIWLMTLGREEMVRHDARVSVLAGFTPREARDLAERAGLENWSFGWNLFTHRFTVAARKPVPGAR